MKSSKYTSLTIQLKIHINKLKRCSVVQCGAENVAVSCNVLQIDAPVHLKLDPYESTIILL